MAQYARSFYLISLSWFNIFRYLLLTEGTIARETRKKSVLAYICWLASKYSTYLRTNITQPTHKPEVNITRHNAYFKVALNSSPKDKDCTLLSHTVTAVCATVTTISTDIPLRCALQNCSFTFSCFLTLIALNVVLYFLFRFLFWLFFDLYLTYLHFPTFPVLETGHYACRETKPLT